MFLQYQYVAKSLLDSFLKNFNGQQTQYVQGNISSGSKTNQDYLLQEYNLTAS